MLIVASGLAWPGHAISERQPVLLAWLLLQPHLPAHLHHKSREDAALAGRGMGSSCSESCVRTAPSRAWSLGYVVALQPLSCLDGHVCQAPLARNSNSD